MSTRDAMAALGNAHELLGDMAMQMSKRELYAALAMQGILSSAESIAAIDAVSAQKGETCAGLATRIAVSHADALITALAARSSEQERTGGTGT